MLSSHAGAHVLALMGVTCFAARIGVDQHITGGPIENPTCEDMPVVLQNAIDSDSVTKQDGLSALFFASIRLALLQCKDRVDAFDRSKTLAKDSLQFIIDFTCQSPVSTQYDNQIEEVLKILSGTSWTPIAEFQTLEESLESQTLQESLSACPATRRNMLLSKFDWRGNWSDTNGFEEGERQQVPYNNDDDWRGVDVPKQSLPPPKFHFPCTAGTVLHVSKHDNVFIENKCKAAAQPGLTCPDKVREFCYYESLASRCCCREGGVDTSTGKKLAGRNCFDDYYLANFGDTFVEVL
jgi:hypothetical protein